MNIPEPGELHVSTILSVFAALDRIHELALEGASLTEIAADLGWRNMDVVRAARLQGFDVSDHIIRPELCPVCGHLLTADRHCEVCSRRKRLERLQLVNAEEHRREVERLDREINAVKSDTRHIRERLGTNPRKHQGERR